MTKTLLSLIAIIVLAGCGASTSDPAPTSGAGTPSIDRNVPIDGPAPVIPADDATESMAPTVDETTSEEQIIDEIDDLINDLDNI